MKYILLIMSFFGIVCVCGCTKVLNKTIEDQVTASTYWNTPTDLELYVNQFYPNLERGGAEWGGIAYFSYDANSDNLQPTSPSEVLAGTRPVPTSASDAGWNWAPVRDINIFFANESKVTGSQAEINQYVGEAYFFRAYFYFNLVKRFGAVPWYSEVLNINSKGLMASRTPRNIVIDSIIGDLNKAIQLLELKKQLPVGRISKGCAILFKSRVCLYEGTWEKYHEGDPFGVKGSNGEKYLKLSVQASELLMEEGNFSIYNTGNPNKDYGVLFSSNDLSNNPEVLLTVADDPSQGMGNWAWTYLNGTRGDGTGITKSLVNAYLCKDGLPIDVSPEYKGDTTISQVVQNRDPRLAQTIWVPGQIEINTQPPLIYKDPPLYKGNADMATTGYMIRKGSTQDPAQNTGSSSARNGEVDGIVFRYAEALLNYAEAKAELGTLTQADIDKSIKLLRDRAGMPDLDMAYANAHPAPVLETKFPNVTGPDKGVILAIRRERRVELALEGFRYDDLMRWAAAKAIKGKRWKGARVIQGESFPTIENNIEGILLDANHYIDRYQKILPNGFGFDPNRDYLYPLPTNQLTLNKNLKQNPGW